MDDVAGKKRPRPVSQDDESRDETEGVVWHDYICPAAGNPCAECKKRQCKKRKGPQATERGPCLRPVHAKIKIPDTLANRALEGVALPDAASLRDLAAAPLTDWGMGQPEAGALVVTIKPPGLGVVVDFLVVFEIYGDFGQFAGEPKRSHVATGAVVIGNGGAAIESNVEARPGDHQPEDLFCFDCA